MTSDQRGDSPHAKERRFDELPQRRRRQLLIIAAIRSLASVIGILIVIVVLSAQTVATLRADYPVLRAVEGIGV